MKPLLSLLLILSTSLSFTLLLPPNTAPYQDTDRLKALDQYWAEVSRTVREGDYEGYGALYHEDAVVIFATRGNKSSMAISEALAGWKPGFDDTKAGKIKANVDFRFSQRIGNENTAHETGVFAYSSEDNAGNKSGDYVAFEMLLVKKNGKWLGMMEYQKNRVTQAEWDALQ